MSCGSSLFRGVGMKVYVVRKEIGDICREFF